jgi:polysaccharide deacetylase family protein (PEP-CTERM system associated)
MQQLQSLRPLAISVDVEEYYHAANLSSVCPVRNWSTFPSRVEFATQKILDLFDVYKQKGTFFVLGYCARKHPGIVKEIVSRGHEVASHGYAHKIAYLQNRKQFLHDIRRSKMLLEDITGKEVKGYRAPNFSIRDENLWAYEMLRNAGYSYDSSLYPVRHDRYGNPHRSVVPEIRETESGPLIIMPLTVFTRRFLNFNIRIPVAGGAYWRLLPEVVIRYMLSDNLVNTDIPVICYLHPWELDSEQPFFSSLSVEKKLRHYSGISGFENKLASIMSHYTSVTISEITQNVHHV